MDLVKANLPGAVADEMQNFIVEAKNNKVKIKDLENHIEYFEGMEKEFKKLKQECIDLNKLSADLVEEREVLNQHVTINNTKTKTHDELNQQGYRETMTDTDSEISTETHGKD